MKKALEYFKENKKGNFPFNYLYLKSSRINAGNKEMVSVKSNKHQTDLYQVKSFYKQISLIY